MTTDSCMHCQGGDKVQVSCDACHAYICVDCHWCHEYQANHEIRVCDRCDSFLCKECEDMDQCHDCGEVVCKSCGTLLTCKFCGASLCDECATSCAKCGIVLCGRDAKFAVDCDTCKLSYCLVCLASGQKEACIRCHARPSKRMEQLVHLRLKSIYKAFQQSARTNESHPNLKRVTLAAMKNAKEPKIDPILAKAKADAAAAALLAELEQEEEDSKQIAKKKRKKKCKGHEELGINNDGGAQAHSVKEQEQCAMKSSSPDIQMQYSTMLQNPILQGREVNRNQNCDDVSVVETDQNQFLTNGTLLEPESRVQSDDGKHSTEDSLEEPRPKQPDPMQSRLCELVYAGDSKGISDLLEDMKGVPGMSKWRKNAKKALKRLQDQEAEQPQPRIKVISTIQKSSTTQETVMEMDSSIVGFVIGRGGQKIRDLMDESGAKVWIDQDSMAIHEPRIVYVSGAKKAVDVAVKMLQEMVKGADNLEPSARPLDVPETSVSEGHGLKQNFPSKREPSVAMLREEITCDARFVPLLIGRRGWTIKNIQDCSGAKVDIDQTVTPRVIKVTGTAESVKTAKRLIGDILSYPQSQLKPEVEDSESFIVDGMHSPPPSKYVMTGDAKSSVSASSSLSSTPEPSMASGREPVLPPPGLFQEAALAQRYPQSVAGFNGGDFAQSHFQTMLHQQVDVLTLNMHQNSHLPLPDQQIGGMTYRQHDPSIQFMGQPTLLPPYQLQQTQSGRRKVNEPTMTSSISMNPALMSQFQLAMQQQHQQMDIPPPRNCEFLSSPGNPNEAGSRRGMGPLGDSRRQSQDHPFSGETSDTHPRGIIPLQHEHTLLPMSLRSQPRRFKESVGVANGSARVQSDAAHTAASAIPTDDIFHGRIPLANTGTRDESNLIDTMFFASGGGGNSLLAGLNGLSVGGDHWEGSEDIPEWNQDQSGRTTTQQPNESRFQWGS